jgi:hypothetical protein
MPVRAMTQPLAPLVEFISASSQSPCLQIEIRWGSGIHRSASDFADAAVIQA